MIYTGRDDNPAIPTECDQCGKPFHPDAITFIEIEVVDREQVEAIRRINEENGYYGND
jgi:hypothetical protein